MLNPSSVKEEAMSDKNKKNNMEPEKLDGIFEGGKAVEISPLPYFTTELLDLPKDIMEFLRKTADKHNCTVSYVIGHFMSDMLSETKDISEITEETLLKASEEKPYMFIKKDGKAFARISFFHEENFQKELDKVV